MIEDLRRLLVEYCPMAEDVYHFDGIPERRQVLKSVASLEDLLNYSKSELKQKLNESNNKSSDRSNL